MTRSLILHHLLSQPIHAQKVVTSMEADRWYEEEWEKLLQLCEAQGVARALFEPLLLPLLLKQKKSDQDILNSLAEYQETELGVRYAKTEIDFYYLKQALFRGRIQPMGVTGFIEKHLLAMHGQDIQALLKVSPYYALAGQFTLENFNQCRAATLDALVAPYVMDGNSDDGLFAKVYHNGKKLAQLRATMKAEVFGMEVKDE